jgi:hypothetical protein
VLGAERATPGWAGGTGISGRDSSCCSSRRSVALHMTVVVPMGKLDPEGGVQTVVAAEQPPAVVTANVAAAAEAPGAAGIVMSAGQAIVVGAVHRAA